MPRWVVVVVVVVVVAAAVVVVGCDDYTGSGFRCCVRISVATTAIILIHFCRVRLSFKYLLEQMTDYDANDIAIEAEKMALLKAQTEDANARKLMGV
jgi:hypothetical protein